MIRKKYSGTLILTFSLLLVVECGAVSVDSTQQPTMDSVNADSEKIIPDSDADEIRNPFIPQIPQIKADESVTNQIQVSHAPEVVSPGDTHVTAIEPVAPPISENIEINPPAVNIRGLIWNTPRPQAIINTSGEDRIINIGDEIESWKVIRINNSGIELSSLDSTVFISSNFGSDYDSKN